MPALVLIAWRYLVTKRKEKFISLISVISVLGIAIGVMALIIVLAVMAGFDRDLREKIIGNYAHISISSYRGIDRAAYERAKPQNAVTINPLRIWPLDLTSKLDRIFSNCLIAFSRWSMARP